MNVNSSQSNSRNVDVNRSENEIDLEVAKIRAAVGGRFLDLAPSERAQAIVKHRSFISKRVNEQLWGIPRQEVANTNEKHNTLYIDLNKVVYSKKDAITR